MKTMIMSDFISLRKYLLTQSAITVITGLFIGIIMQNLYAIPACVGCMIAIVMMMGLFAYDERNNWEAFRLTLPLSRKQIIVGRYTFCLMGVTVGIIFGFVIFGLAAALLFAVESFAPGTIPGAATMLGDIAWEPMVLVGAVSICLMLIVMGISFPLVSRFGMTRAIRFVPFIPIIAIPLITLLAQQLGFTTPQFISDFIAWVSAPAGAISVSALSIAACLGIYAVSCLIAIKLYRKREF